MSEFQLFLQMGFEHISDPNGYDHILFILALCAVYQPKDWKQILVLVTAFTLGHSITLALATLQIVNVSGDVIEFLIPVTILITAIFNYFHHSSRSNQKMNKRYLVALFFGLIHGLGFSNYLRSLLGKDESIFTQLLAFNIGLELGQLMIVAFILLFTFIFENMGKVKKREWNLLLSGAAGGIAFIMMMERNIFF